MNLIQSTLSEYMKISIIPTLVLPSVMKPIISWEDIHPHSVVIIYLTLFTSTIKACKYHHQNHNFTTLFTRCGENTSWQISYYSLIRLKLHKNIVARHHTVQKIWQKSCFIYKTGTQTQRTRRIETWSEPGWMKILSVQGRLHWTTGRRFQILQ